MDLTTLSVIPCRDKKPLVPWKEYQTRIATHEERLVWKAMWPDHQLALVCGKISQGITVLDVDDEVAAAKIRVEQSGLARMHETPSNGLHVFFREMDGLSPSKPLIPGRFDLKANGGYVIIPPSPGYVVIDDGPIQEVSYGEDHITRWLKLMGYWEVQTPALTVPSANQAWIEGQRNIVLTRLAGSLRRQGMDADGMVVVLSEANRRLCKPPLPDSEVHTIAHSCARYAPLTLPRVVVPTGPQAESLTELLVARQTIPLVPYSLDWLNDQLAGARPGELIVVGGRSGEGKTSFAVSWLHQLASQQIVATYLSLEESREAILSRLAVMTYDTLHPKRLDMVDLREEDWATLGAFDQLAQVWSVTVRDNLGFQVEDATAFLDAHPCQLVFVDHIQQVARRHGMNEHESLAHEVYGWKRLAVERKMVVVLLSQLNRNVYQRDTDEPHMGDLKGTGVLEQAADLILLLWWPKRGEGGRHHLKIEKNRRGLRHTGLGLVFNGPLRQFSDTTVPLEDGDAA